MPPEACLQEVVVPAVNVPKWTGCGGPRSSCGFGESCPSHPKRLPLIFRMGRAGDHDGFGPWYTTCLSAGRQDADAPVVHLHWPLIDIGQDIFFSTTRSPANSVPQACATVSGSCRTAVRLGPFAGASRATRQTRRLENWNHRGLATRWVESAGGHESQLSQRTLPTVSRGREEEHKVARSNDTEETVFSHPKITMHA